jgi:hypothetical protein
VWWGRLVPTGSTVDAWDLHNRQTRNARPIGRRQVLPHLAVIDGRNHYGRNPHAIVNRAGKFTCRAAKDGLSADTQNRRMKLSRSTGVLHQGLLCLRDQAVSEEKDLQFPSLTTAPPDTNIAPPRRLLAGALWLAQFTVGVVVRQQTLHAIRVYLGEDPKGPGAEMGGWENNRGVSGEPRNSAPAG